MKRYARTSVAESKSKQSRWKPNVVPLSDRVLSLALALVLLAYSLSGILHGKFKVAPPGSRIGLVLHDRPAWLLAAAIFTGSLVLLSVVVDHYDKRNNEHWYRLFKQVAISLGLCLLIAALISGFCVALVG